MPKKLKRQTRRSTTRISEEQTAGRNARSSGREFDPDYSYVVKDLKRIGALAGSFFLILVVLSFFLR